MDTAAQKIIFSIELDTSTLLQNAADAKQEIDALKSKQKELADSGKVNTAAFQEVTTQLRQATASYREINKEIDNTTKASKAAADSNTQLKANLSLLTKQYNDLSKEQRNSKDVGGALQKQIKGISDTLKTNEQAIGDNHRSIGDYGKALGGLPGPLGNAVQGVGGLKTAFLELLANPIVLLIAAIVLAIKFLFDAFKSTDKGAVEFEGTMARVGAIMEVIRQKAASLAMAIVDVFKGDFKKAAEDFNDAIDVSAKRFKDASDAAYNYVKQLDELTDSEDNYVSNKAENENKIAKAEFAAADRSNTIEQRKQYLLEALALSKEESEHAQKAAQTRLDIEADNLAKLNGVSKEEVILFLKMSDAEQANASESLQRVRNMNEQKFKDLEGYYAKVIEADTAYFQENKKNNGKITAFEDQIKQDKQKAQDDAVKKAKEYQDKTYNQYVSNLKNTEAIDKLMVAESIKGSQEEFEAKLQLLKTQLNVELAQQGLTNGQKLLAEKNYQLAVQKLYQDSEKTQQEIAKQNIENKIGNIEDETELEAAKLSLQAVKQKAQLDKEYQEGVITYREYKQKLLNLDTETFVKQRQLLIQQLQQEEKLYAEDSKEYIQLKLKEAQAQEDIQTKVAEQNIKSIGKGKSAQLMAYNEMANSASNFFGGLASLFDQGSEAYKDFSILQVVASTASGAIGAFSQASQTYPAPYGEILGALMAGVVVAEGAAQISKIESLETGGYTTAGNPHQEATNLGDKPYTYHKSEYVVPARVLNTEIGGALVNNLEAIRLNNFIPSGMTGMFDGGFAAQKISSGVVNEVKKAANIQNVLLNLPQQHVLVEDINSAQSKKVAVKQKSSM